MDENNEWNEGVESDFCLSASSQSVTACLHGTLEKFDLKAFFQRGFCNTCFTLWKSLFLIYFPKHNQPELSNLNKVVIVLF